MRFAVTPISISCSRTVRDHTMGLMWAAVTPLSCFWTVRDPTLRPGGGQAARTPREGIRDSLRTGQRSSALLRCVLFFCCHLSLFYLFIFCRGRSRFLPPEFVPVCLHVTLVAGPHSFCPFWLLVLVDCLLPSIDRAGVLSWFQGFFFFVFFRHTFFLLPLINSMFSSIFSSFSLCTIVILELFVKPDGFFF